MDELRSRIPLEEVVSEYVPLKQKGRRYWGCCPFHNEKTASFSVDTEAQMYYCFGCHKGGTVITFVMEMEHMEFMDAVRLLADRAHMDLPANSAQPGAQQASRELRERIYEANREAARHYHALLWTPEGAEALAYLYSRSLTDADIRRFGLGASAKSGDDLTAHLQVQGYEPALLVRAGLATQREGRLIDMFRGRAMFPIINAQGRVLGFGGRALGNAQPKYLNTAETPVFNKRQNLYALNFAHRERAIGHLVLVEGYMDAISLRKHGIGGVVATLGTALTEEQARLMKRYAGEVWISYDGDPPGQKAALRALDILEGAGISAHVIDYPEGMDPDDFIKAHGQQGFDALPHHDAASYRMLRAKDGLDMDSQDGVTQYALRACEILRRVKNPVVMENHLRKLIHETGYDRETLLRQIGTPAPQATPRTRRLRQPETADTSEPILAEQALLSLLSRHMIPDGLLRADDFSDPVHRTLAERLLAGESPGAFIESLDAEAQRNRAAAALNYTPLPGTQDEAIQLAEDCLKNIRNRRADARAEEILSQIGTATEAQKRALYEQLDTLFGSD